MSRTTVLAVAPDRRPAEILKLHNSFGWAPSIWDRLLRYRTGEGYKSFGPDDPLYALWQDIEYLPDWQQIPLVLTFDTGVIPAQEFMAAADALNEFDHLLPAPRNHANHVSDVADLLRSQPETPFVGVWGTSVSDNPFDPWNASKDEPGSGISLDEMYLLEHHRHYVEETP